MMDDSAEKTRRTAALYSKGVSGEKPFGLGRGLRERWRPSICLS